MAFNTAHFARMPESRKAHSLAKRPHIHAGTCLHGKIVPIYCRLVAPGSVLNEHIYGNIRMSTPIAPLYSSIKASFNAFWVPLRLLWTHLPEFFGENKTTAGPQTNQFKIPMLGLNYSDNSATRVTVGSVSHYLGKPLYKGSSLDSATGTSGPKVSVLKERCYWTIINEYYRMEQVQAPILVDTSDYGAIGTRNGSTLSFGTECENCLKDFDYFTTMTRSPQYGPDVTLPLGTVAPIIADSTLHDLGGEMYFNRLVDGDDSYVNGLSVGVTSGLVGENRGTDEQVAIRDGSGGAAITKTNLVADLSEATAASIDELYLAMAAQAWYHAANYGSRYFEQLQLHYGTYNPDLVLNRPEHVGEAKRYIQVQQVLSTAGATGSTDTKLGQPGANSSTNIDIKFPKVACGEWGFYMVLMNTYHERYYNGGVLREDTYEEMFDFFFPEFSSIGDQGVKEIEAFYTSGSNPEDIIGFQEAWAEMRYTPNQLSGLFDSYAASGTNSSSNALKQWVLADKWDEAPSLSTSFLQENRDAIKNVLVTGEAGPDYLFYFYFDEKILQLVPLFSVPGLPGRGRGIL